MRYRSLALFFAFFFAHQSAFAAILFGGEFTLTNSEILRGEKSEFVNSPEAVAAQRKLLQRYTEHCLAVMECKVEPIVNSYGVETYRVHFPLDNFWLQISSDPGVVEIQTKPSTLEEFRKNKKHIDDLFSAGEQVGIRPDPMGNGAGHIHMDMKSAFGKDGRLFRNFLVDFMNHQELGHLGLLGGDAGNSPHLAYMQPHQQQAFLDIIKEFDAGKIKTPAALATAVNERVYTENPRDMNPKDKYQALNLTRAAKKNGTVEFRAIDPQSGFNEFAKELDLFEHRVEYLRGQKMNLDLPNFSPMARSDKPSSFRAYVEESGLQWSDYQSIAKNAQAHQLAEAVATTRNVFVEPTNPSTWNSLGQFGENCQAYFRSLMGRPTL